MYNNIKELPEATKSLPFKAKRIYLAAYNLANSKFSPLASDEIAWLAVKSKFEESNNKWVVRSVVEDTIKYLTMYITKATIKDGQMFWQATASDTGLDLFEERMSIQLYKSFIDRSTGNEFVSLSHYPRLNGLGELGKVTSVYVDGNLLKTKGIFYNTEIGKAAYESIKKDKLDNVPFDQRIRISIGFFDYKHEHEGYGVWSKNSGQPCMMCASGIKEKVYLDGLLDHCALTRSPARVTTNIEV